MKNYSQEDIYRMSHSLLQSPDIPIRRLTIGTPVVEKDGGYAIQRCIVSLGDVEREIYFKLRVEYADYLSFERGDAYLIGLLSLAMRERCDIYSEVPLTRELVHQLNTELIPALVKYAPALYTPAIHAELAETPLPSAGKVGTGCSCGVDSLYAIKSLTGEHASSYHLDYLTINNVGAYSWEGETSDIRRSDNEENARRFCAQYGYKLIVTNSNFAEAFPQEHLKTHLYSSGFAIHMLSKLWGRYYYASTGFDMQAYFGLSNNELYDAAKYDLIALPAFSTSQLRICNQGSTVNRFVKTQELADFAPARYYLNVCLRQGKGNCGECPKCLRTLWMLDALGKLDDFSEVFNIEKYRKNRQFNLGLLYMNYRAGGDHHMNDAAWEILKRDVHFSTRMWVRLEKPRVHVRKILRAGKRCLKRLILLRN